MERWKPLKIGELIARKPLIQGGMGVGISLSSLAGAVAKEGGIGVISAAQIGYKEPEWENNPLEANLKAIEKEIKKAREIANDGILGINIMVATRFYERYVKKAIESGIDLIISGAGLPTELPAYISGSKVKIAPIVSTLKSIQVISKYWERKYQKQPDLVVIEGPQAGGHLGFPVDELEKLEKRNSYEYDNEVRQILDFVKKLERKENIKIPVVVAGGIYDKKDMEHYIELGADGIQVGTRFVTTYECDASREFKEAYLNASKEEIELVKSPVGMPARGLKNLLVKEFNKPDKCYQCIKKCNPAEIPYCITKALIRAVKGDVEKGMVFCGANAYRANKMETVKEVMDSFFGKH
ncbi:NAD(P)H-dependent flavin oxidoreductase [Velocimicrobium porci]|uniref:Probable nitronate monooxygenase n=1 Tax=Velocimicrobium porci TaxID=2606634 RepID=A0A6L5XVS5_9FIRM|nr:nitronate monooxygenase family protein [Velocimicrobium porci]MSS62920.1 nitronate monooxygenase [Velocimicrobium porci]